MSHPFDLLHPPLFAKQEGIESRDTMDLESESRKKKQLLVLLDPYGLEMAIPKELQPHKRGTAAGAAIGLRFQVPDVGQSMKNFFRTREVGEFISGALAGAMTKAVLAPLETIRTRMVVGVGSKHIAGSFIEVIEENGWQGLWAGNTINMLRIIPTQAIEFATFECVTRTMTAAQAKWKEKQKLQIGPINIDLSFPWISPVAVGGAAAGIVSTLVCHPLEVIKDRLTVNREAYPSITLAFRKICMDDGIGGLYAGLSPTLMGMLPYSTCYYFMYETLKTKYCQAHKKKSLNRAELLIIGAPSGDCLFFLEQVGWLFACLLSFYIKMW